MSPFHLKLESITPMYHIHTEVYMYITEYKFKEPSLLTLKIIKFFKCYGCFLKLPLFGTCGNS